MTAEGPGVAIDAGLRARFVAAGASIAWRDVPGTATARPKRGAPTRRVRIAHLNDEESRVEEHDDGAAPRLIVDSGPVGALVLVLRWNERGAPSRLVPHEAGVIEGFPSGALEAEWRGGSAPPALAVPLSDLVALARYALA